MLKCSALRLYTFEEFLIWQSDFDFTTDLYKKLSTEVCMGIHLHTIVLILFSGSP